MVSAEEQKMIDESIAFAKANKDSIAKKLTAIEVYSSEEEPVSVFMAGSPGAGKTEASKNLLEKFSDHSKIVRIDPDDLRSLIPGYTGDNSYLFNSAISILVERVLDFVYPNKQSFILDGTLSKIEVGRKNIQRSLNKKRFVQILYVYQDPIQAWKFVQERELKEGRKIRREDFIAHYFSARDSVNRLKEEFGVSIQVDLLVKNIDGSDLFYKENIDKIDNYVKEVYTLDTLNSVLQ